MELKDKIKRFEYLCNKRYCTDKEDIEFDKLADDKELGKYLNKQI